MGERGDLESLEGLVIARGMERDLKSLEEWEVTHDH